MSNHKDNNLPRTGGTAELKMLKWRVGGRGSPCCSALRRPPFKIKHRQSSTDKENSTEGRESVYMRLEAMPAALRDLSNYRRPEDSPRTPEQVTPSRKRPRSPRKTEGGRENERVRRLENGSGSPERKKQPCTEAARHQILRHNMDLQIDYSPCPLRAAQSLVALHRTLADTVAFSPSPVELDHKEIPLEPEEKELILSTPIASRRPAVREEINKILGVGLSPLARRLAHLKVENTKPERKSPSSVFLRPGTTARAIPVPLCHNGNKFLENDILRSWLRPDSADTKTFARPSTNHDRTAKSVFSENIVVCNDKSRKRRGIVFNENTFSLNTPPASESEERRSSSFTASVDLEAPSTLKRQRVIRRRRAGNRDEEHHPLRKMPRRPHPISCLTLPDGVPSPFYPESAVVRSPLGLTLPEGIPSPPSPPDDLADPLPPSPRPSSEHTWDSHRVYLAKNNAQETSVTSSKINDEDDEDATSSVASWSVTAGSPQNEMSRSRRCLTFPSPGSRNRSQTSRSSSKIQGELELRICYSSGVLTVHVIRGKNLVSPGSDSCNPYVKVSLVPNGRPPHRTVVRRDSSQPRFDSKFTFHLTQEDLAKRLLLSAWHRDRGNRKSEFLGCMSFAVKHAIKKEISGLFRLLSQSCGRAKNLPSMTNTEHTGHQQLDTMANQSESSVEELVSVEESEIAPTPDHGKDRRKSFGKKEGEKGVVDDHIFLRHLELDPLDETASPPVTGRTPFTTTRTLKRHQGSSYGFSIAWTHPPRIERVEAGLPAEQAGLRPGDYVIFVEKTNVVTLPEEEILRLIKSCGNQLILEVYRKSNINGVFSRGQGGNNPQQHPRSSTACSATTTATTSIELSKRRLHLPQVTFNSEYQSLKQGNNVGEEEIRKRSVYQLLGKEQQYALCLQFGIARFLLPLSERKDLITHPEHIVLFQNAQELLRHTEDILELYMQDEVLGQSLGRIYLKKMSVINNAYRRYCIGLKKADCLLVEKTRHSEFMKLITEPAIPRRRPDLTTFLHKPLEHYREVLKLLQTILNSTKSKDEDYNALSKVVHEMQATYRDITVESGLMEPDGEGRPLLSLQDLESRLVFTRCKPFVLSSPGRQWIFGGDLSRVEGRSVRPFWALLFTDLLLFAKVSRDRVIFVTEEPLSLATVSQALFSIRKKATEFRLLVSNTPIGADSPAVGVCADLPLSRTPRKGPRRRTVALRAPTPELKAVWQNLIQRQIIYVNTARGGTPASSPMDSPDPLTADSLESVCLKRQAQESKSYVVDDLIEHRCRQLGKAGVSKGSALHLAQWMRGQLGSEGQVTPDTEPEPEVWSPGTLRRRTEEIGGGAVPRNVSRCEEVEVSDYEQTQSRSTSDSQMTVKSNTANSERLVAVCRKCQKTCLLSNNNKTNKSMTLLTDINANPSHQDENGFLDENNWGQVGFTTSSTLSPTDPFHPVPHIAVLPPTPTGAMHVSTSGNNNTGWSDAELSHPNDHAKSTEDSKKPKCFATNEGDNDGDESDGEIEDPPYRSLSPCGLKRYGTVSSLEKLEESEEEEDEEEDDTSKEQDDLPQDGQSQFETVSQSIRGWTVRAGSFVAEKMAFFERISDDSMGTSFIERYLRSSVEQVHQKELIATSTALAGEDECETSGATSGEEVWGTPTSGGSELTSPNTELSDSPVGTAADDAREQLMMEQLLGGVSFMGNLMPLGPVSGPRFPQRRRLEPLPEDEEDSSVSTTPDNSEATKSYTTDQGNKSDSCPSRAKSATSTPHHRFFNKLKLRRSQSAESRPSKPNKFMEFLRSSKSEEHTSSSGKRLMRLFSRESQDDIPTTLPPDFVPKKEHDKVLDRRFWKQLRKRRSSGGSVSPKTTISAS